jgi:hypothetical protein
MSARNRCCTLPQHTGVLLPLLIARSSRCNSGVVCG